MTSTSNGTEGGSPPPVDSNFYKKAQDYWKNISPTIDGVLGGFGYVSKTDISGSETFLKSILKLENPPKQERALDCGAGIGRITKDLLVHFFDKVDLVDQNEEFIQKAQEHIKCDGHVGSLYVSGLQDFHPEHKYDVIWCQWVLGHLTDVDFVTFMQNCLNSLNENGVIIVKENVTSTPEIQLDEVDSSITRPLDILLSLLEKSGLSCIKIKNQTGFPKALYAVKMIALRRSTKS